MNGVLIFVGISFVIAILLTYISYILNNKEGKNVSKIRDMLPGYNCGACGFVGCDQMAENLVDDKDLLILACERLVCISVYNIRVAVIILPQKRLIMLKTNNKRR